MYAVTYVAQKPYYDTMDVARKLRDDGFTLAANIPRQHGLVSWGSQTGYVFTGQEVTIVLFSGIKDDKKASYRTISSPKKRSLVYFLERHAYCTEGLECKDNLDYQVEPIREYKQVPGYYGT